ncbi:hypothetical protein D9X30_5978 [Cupriavidus sp. U2]|uniref:hypothetical protein n=1 Tax=Cupriavidus sp. U2 TaxID=2920269 RepID=UPI00129D47DA|nr:hypothetical protein [Cupriavidus sp. U2]KAI3589166.1 hypothetical protein D9X30_5978 [Cupriavidus sp. U2]
MAVDFSLLPSEETFEEKPPSWRLWGVLFVAAVLVGVAAVLLLWPDGMPTDTWRFWATLILFPVAMPAFVVLRRLAHHESSRLDAEMRNAAVVAFKEQVFSAASIPLALLGAAHRFSADSSQNSADGVREGTLRIKTQKPVAYDTAPVKARWFDVAGVPMAPGTINADFKRASLLTPWLLDQLLAELAPRIEALPLAVPLDVRLHVVNALPLEQNRRLWDECWGARFARAASLEIPALPDDLMALDRWLDRLLAGGEPRATLFVSVQLRPVLHASLPDGSAEAGVAVLLMPDALAHKHGIHRAANLHRPVRGLAMEPQEAYSHALRWAGIGAGELAGAWQAGLDANQAGALRQATMKLGMALHATDLDQTVGHAGVAAGWLALSCAAATLTDATAKQVVMAGQGTSVDCAVIRRDNPAHGGPDTEPSRNDCNDQTL